MLFRSRTLSLTLFKDYSPPELITGLSSANYHGKIILGKVLPIPQRSSHQNLSEASLPHRVFPCRVIFPTSLFPNGVIFSYRFILATIIPSGNEELYSSASAQDSTSSRQSSRIYFPRRKYIHKTYHISYLLYMHTHHTTQSHLFLRTS